VLALSKFAYSSMGHVSPIYDLLLGPSEESRKTVGPPGAQLQNFLYFLFQLANVYDRFQIYQKYTSTVVVCGG
jgi:hypothetical protein